MDVYLINFATDERDQGFKNLKPHQDKQNATAQQVGIQNIVSWSRQQLKQTDFYQEHRYLLDQRRAGGHGVWKPYIMLELFQQINDGDIVFYLDTDIKFVAEPQPLFDLCVQNQGFFFVELRDDNRRNRLWVKRDSFHFMGLDEPLYHDGPHTASGLQIYQKNLETVAFVEELLHYSVQRRVIGLDPSGCGKPELDGYIDHRTDQAVLSLLRLKHGIEGFRWPTEWGNHYKLPEYRVEGEFLATENYADQPYENSPYGTLLSSTWHFDDDTTLQAANQSIDILAPIQKQPDRRPILPHLNRLKHRVKVLLGLPLDKSITHPERNVPQQPDALPAMTASVGVGDQDVIRAFDADPDNPYLVSFPRTGSHWLRMLIELYFERPTLKRAFYYPDRHDYLLLHTHDLELDVQRRNVIYLYRDPVETVYSQLQYHHENPNDTGRITHWADLYGRHLDKWLRTETCTTHKTIVTYEGLRRDLPFEYAKITAHFDTAFDYERFDNVAQRVTKEEVKRKTPHDEQVMQLGTAYQTTRDEFTAAHADLVWDVVLNNRPHLRDIFDDISGA
ncbi:MAG: sulfotransferase domain-containing protein [Anaerolineae bacterium]|nr:sulfotransferase domain-containing protein [Anaerolineae bacterium]